MKTYSREYWVILFTLIVGFFSINTHADNLNVGAQLPKFTLNDQFDRPVLIDTNIKWLVFSQDKPVNAFVSEYMNEQGAQQIRQRGIVYVADISGMPTLVTRMFALPKMRKLSFPIGLARDSKTLADIPRRAGAATVLRLRSGVVQNIIFANNPAQLKQNIQ
ncbi:MAG: hypothetical protein H6R05_236 [Burkholderiaceae bacterium]|nr:hypothetical protein [Burkholderiaceae bacterium]